jgi:hypothetical protein
MLSFLMSAVSPLSPSCSSPHSLVLACSTRRPYFAYLTRPVALIVLFDLPVVVSFVRIVAVV